MTKCKRAKEPWNRPTLCEGMSLALHGVPENHTGKGLTLTRGWLETDGPTPERPHKPMLPSYIGVTYIESRNSHGIVCNFCPWCGERIRFDEAEAPRG